VLLEILFQLVGELLLQVVLQVLIELGFHSIVAPFRRTPNPWLAAIGYALLGATAGALSLLAYPALLIVSHTGRLVNLVLTPILAGAAMTALGAWRRGRDQELIRLDRFTYGFLFALAMALVRFHFAN
jgi:hypothetical protein